MGDFQATADFIWGIADILRGDYYRREYPDVILPMVVLRRLDQAMEKTRDAVRAEYLKYQGYFILKSAFKRFRLKPQ